MSFFLATTFAQKPFRKAKIPLEQSEIQLSNGMAQMKTEIHSKKVSNLHR